MKYTKTMFESFKKLSDYNHSKLAELIKKAKKGECTYDDYIKMEDLIKELQALELVLIDERRKEK